MSDIEIKFDDEYIEETGKAIGEWGDKLQEFADKYVKIINTVSQSAFVKGDTAKALRRFADYASVLSSGVVGGLQTSSSKTPSNTSSEMDKIISGTCEECKGMGINYVVELEDTDNTWS